MDAAMTREQTGTKLKWLWLAVAVIAIDRHADLWPAGAGGALVQPDPAA